jgi:hypothetical protein
MNDEFIKQSLVKLFQNSMTNHRDYLTINNFKCLYDKNILPCFLNFLRTNKMKYLGAPNKFYKMKSFLQKFMKNSERKKLETIWNEQFCLEIDFFQGKNSLTLKTDSFKSEILKFFQVSFFHLFSD